MDHLVGDGPLDLGILLVSGKLIQVEEFPNAEKLWYVEGNCSHNCRDDI